MFTNLNSSLPSSSHVPGLLFLIPSLQILDLETVACHVGSGTRVSRYLRCERPCVDLSHTLRRLVDLTSNISNQFIAQQK